MKIKNEKLKIKNEKNWSYHFTVAKEDSIFFFSIFVLILNFLFLIFDLLVLIFNSKVYFQVNITLFYTISMMNTPVDSKLHYKHN